MGLDQIFSSMNISASGLSAERLRMEVIAHNIANAHTTQTPNGGPYRRQEVVFASALNDHFKAGDPASSKLGGVEVVGVVDDMSDLQTLYNPGHPDADSDGFVSMPNVDLPIEMVDLVTASRAYEANLRVLQSLRQMSEQALALVRG